MVKIGQKMVNVVDRCIKNGFLLRIGKIDLTILLYQGQHGALKSGGGHSIRAIQIGKF